MKLLIIGGTRFVGRAAVEAALQNGHEVTLFNRGNTNPDLFPDVEKIQGDREDPAAFKALQGRQWDAVIDTCGYVPRVVTLAAEQLAQGVGSYVFISSISVYAEQIYSTPNTDEDGALAQLDDPTVEEVTGATYGGLKVLCEQAALNAMPNRTLIIRPGLIVGPHDYTDRFTYWVWNMQRRQQMLVPPLDALMQVIDVRDLMRWMIAMIEARQQGIYNATGNPLRVGDVLEASRAALDGAPSAQIVEVSESFLQAQNVAAWSDLPLWLPAAQNGIAQVSIERATRAGLTFRPLETTLRDTLAWRRQDPQPLRTGLSDMRQDELLALWQAQA